MHSSAVACLWNGLLSGPRGNVTGSGKSVCLWDKKYKEEEEKEVVVVWVALARHYNVSHSFL